jgi:hypothetical protein
MTTTSNTPPRLSLRIAINAKCRDCMFDPLGRGTWREQIASCESSNCALHDIRPVPRDCMDGGRICPDKVGAIRVKICPTVAA